MIIDGKDYSGSEATQDIIKRAYLELCLERGKANVYPSDIVRRANFSRRTFYRHFNDINQLHNDVFEDALPRDVCLDVHNRRDTIPLEEVTDNIIPFFEKRPLATRFFLGQDEDIEYKLEVARLLKILFAALITRSFELDPDDLDSLSEALTYARLSLITLWAHKGADHAPQSLRWMNQIAGNVMEEPFWVQIAAAASPGCAKKSFSKQDLANYPWM